MIRPSLRTTVLAAVLGLVLASPCLAQSKDPLAAQGRWTGAEAGAAATPPMGWNSWNAFHTDITEDKLMGAAQTIVDSGLAKLGYRYINIDDGWWIRRRQGDGRLQVRTAIFPSAAVGGAQETSFRPLTDRLHAMGLKAGIYTDIGRNACSQAYNLSSPNLPVGTAAEREVGLYGNVEKDIALYFGDWNFNTLTSATTFGTSVVSGGVTAMISTSPASVDTLGMAFTQQFCSATTGGTCSNSCQSAPCYVQTNVGSFSYGNRGSIQIKGGSTPGTAEVRANATYGGVATQMSVFGTVQ